MILINVLTPWYNILMKCLICSTKHKNAKYCSRTCSEKAKFGRKRPDLVLRNKTNNPIWDSEVKAKMVQALTGKKQLKKNVEKRRKSILERHRKDPSLRIRQTRKMVEHAKNKPIGWPRARKLALKRDNNTCQTCGASDKRLVVHHKDHNGRSLKFIRDMNNELTNLISLCYGCHNTQHMWPVRKQKKLLSP